MFTIFPLLLLAHGLTTSRLHSRESAPEQSLAPTYLALSPNLNDFGRFANGGPDGNWYVGFNNAWIVQLPAPPADEYVRAFIGAKLGRAKTRPIPGRPWEREIIPGKVYVAISPTTKFTSEQSFFLAETSDIPLEPDPKVYLPGMGESQWFWAEVPLGLINFSGPNYLIAWSPTELFVTVSISPVLAASEMRKDTATTGVRAWVNRSIRGVPPRRALGALETPINTLMPALAIKLIPANDARMRVTGCSAHIQDKSLLFHFSVSGDNPEISWLEASLDRLDWQRVSRYIRQPPYSVTLADSDLPEGDIYIRAVARGTLGNSGTCPPIYVPTFRE